MNEAREVIELRRVDNNLQMRQIMCKSLFLRQ